MRRVILKRIACLLAAVTVTPVFIPKASAQPSNAQQELVQLERDWCAALVKKDATMIARILAEDYTAVGSRGTTSTKAGDLADLKDTSSTLTLCVDDNVKVRVYGDTAVVTAHGRRSGTYKGAAFNDREILYTDTFVKTNGRWQCVASHGAVPAAQQK